MERQSAVRFPKLLEWLAGREKARHDEGGVRIQQHATTTQGRCLRAKTLALHMLLVWWCGGGGVAVVGVVVVWYQQHVMMIDFTDGSFHYLLKIFHIYYTCRCASCRKQTFQMSPFRYDVGGQHTCLSRRIPGFESLYRNFCFLQHSLLILFIMVAGRA